MKLRIKGNSIRLRLGQSEVYRLAMHGAVEESTIFGSGRGQRLGYEIRGARDETGVRASFDGRRIVVHVPAEMIKRWAGSDQVGIYAMQPTDEGDFAVVIEKDFVCIDGDSRESQEDAFPNPALAAGTRSC
jgi:Family of unknown function (DUF7009)